MSLKSRGGNIGKIKYFLPARKYEDSRENIQPNYAKKTTINASSFLESSESKDRRQSRTTLDSKNRNSVERLQERRYSRPLGPLGDPSRQSAYTSKHQQSIEVDIVGIKDVSSIMEREQKKSILDMFPEDSEKQQFFEFLEQLKNDQEYQNSITMFTILYYYKKKQSKPHPKSATK